MAVVGTNILVPGGAGLVGVHVCAALEAAGHTPIVLDPRCSHSRTALPCSMEDALHIDLLDARPAGIIHLAAHPIAISECNDSLARTIQGHVNPLSASLEMAARHDIPVVFVSSAAVYPLEMPGAKNSWGEWDCLDASVPPTIYGQVKFQCERMVAQWARRYVNARLFNVADKSIGEGAVARFWRAAAAGNDLMIAGNGSQERDFVPSRLVGERLVAFLERAMEREKCRETLNLCTGVGRRVRDVACDAINENPGTGSGLQFLPGPTGAKRSIGSLTLSELFLQPDSAER